MSRIVAVIGDDGAAETTFFALFAQLYGGKYSGGICSISGKRFCLFREPGLLSQTITQTDVNVLEGAIAIGHISSLANDLQPITMETKSGKLAICGDCAPEWILRIIDYLKAAPKINQTVIVEWMKNNIGPWAFLIINKNRIYAFRGDGRKPLVFGRLDDQGFIIASQENAIVTVGGTILRHLEPGEVASFDKGQIRTLFCDCDRSATVRCIREVVYTQSPAATWGGSLIQNLRIATGRILGELIDVKVDWVYPVQLGGNPFAQGIYEVLPRGTRFNPAGFTKVNYPRPEIVPIEAVCSLTDPQEIAGRNVLIVNDTLQSGGEIAYLAGLCRRAGAIRIHVAVACLALSNCPYGGEIPIDLMGQDKTNKEIAIALGVDSFVSLPLNDICRAITTPRIVFCAECLEE